MRNNQASETKWSRLLKKRELVAYYVLCNDKRVWNLGDAIDFLVKNVLFNRKVAFNVVRRLRRLGLLVHKEDLVYECVPFNEYMEELVRNYISRRAKRLRQ